MHRSILLNHNLNIFYLLGQNPQYSNDDGEQNNLLIL